MHHLFILFYINSLLLSEMKLGISSIFCLTLFLASVDLFIQLIAFANSLDPDQA